MQEKINETRKNFLDSLDSDESLSEILSESDCEVLESNLGNGIKVQNNVITTEIPTEDKIGIESQNDEAMMKKIHQE